MPRHQHRTTWEKVAKDINVTITGGPDFGPFTQLEAQTTTQEGLEIRHLNVLMSIGTVNTTPPTVMSNWNSGLMGFFKWPENAATPTPTTILVEGSSLIFARKAWVTQHDIPSRYVLRWPKVFLRPGEALWHFVQMRRQSSSVADVDGLAQMTYVKTSR